jgi:hypothetical protein
VLFQREVGVIQVGRDHALDHDCPLFVGPKPRVDMWGVLVLGRLLEEAVM